MNPPYALELQHVDKRYGPALVLDDVSLTATPGEVHAIVGENGAGKSTLLKIMSGLVRPDGGGMRIDGHEVDLDSLGPSDAQRLGIAVVQQEFALLPAMTVAENVFLGREPTRFGLVDRATMRRRTRELLSDLGSAIEPDERVGNLNVAQFQVIEIAKALSADARIVAMDEPSAVLSGDELETLFDVVARLRDSGVAVLYVSHRMDELFRLCDRYTVLKDGKVVGTGRIEETDRDSIVAMMVGRDVSTVFPGPAHPPGDVRLEVETLTVPGLRAPVDLTVRAGEIVGIAGLGGSGRSRLVRAIFGATPVTSGRIAVDGTDVGPFASPAAAIRHGIAYLPEDRKTTGLALIRTVAENSTLLTLDQLRRGPLLSPGSERSAAAEQIRQLQIRTAPDGDAPVSSLSGGNQQKVVFAKWLAPEPKVLLLDEPTRGIDVGSKEQIYELIRELADQGAAVLMVSSELVEVLGLSDRVLVMSDGAIVGELGAGASEGDVMSMITTSTLPVLDDAALRATAGGGS